MEHFTCAEPCCWYEELDLALADEVILDLCFKQSDANKPRHGKMRPTQ